jgi:hypothetical protein
MSKSFKGSSADMREWQADYFAACLKLPKKTVEIFARNYIAEKNLGCGVIRVNDKEAFLHAEQLCIAVADFFATSQQAARIRLQELRIIRELDAVKYAMYKRKDHERIG